MYVTCGREKKSCVVYTSITAAKCLLAKCGINFANSQFSRKVSVLDHMLLHNFDINVTIAAILVYIRKVSTMLKSRNSVIADALENLAGAPNLLSSNFC